MGHNPDDEMDIPMVSEENAKREALSLILDAWDDGLQRGIEPEILATTAIFAAFTDLIDTYGEERVAEMAETLPSRIRQGEFTLAETEH